MNINLALRSGDVSDIVALMVDNNKRLTRVESRLCKFMAAQGVSPVLTPADLHKPDYPRNERKRDGTV